MRREEGKKGERGEGERERKEGRVSDCDEGGISH